MCPERMNINCFLSVNLSINIQSKFKELLIGMNHDAGERGIISSLFFSRPGVKSLVGFAWNNVSFLSWVYFFFDDTRSALLNFTVNTQYFAVTPLSVCNYPGFKAQHSSTPLTKTSTATYPGPWPFLFCSQSLSHKCVQNELN